MLDKIATFSRRASRRLFRPFTRSISKSTSEWQRQNREYLLRKELFDIIAGFVSDCKIEGDYLEFGCAGGSSLIDMFDSTRQFSNLSAMRYYIFDSFQGLPEPTGLDADEFRRYGKGEYACDLDQYRRNVSAGGVDLNRVECTPGWYDQSLTPALQQRLPIRQAAIILVDCDLYESTVPVLDFVTKYIQTGTVMIFDDWFSYKGRLDRGEAKAFYEWLAKHRHIRANEYHKSGRTMASFLMQIDEPASSTAG